MLNSNFAKVVVFVLCALIKLSHNIDNFDIESMAVSCPERDKCSGYKFDKNYTERNCECDAACLGYNDCCVDFRRPPKNVELPENVHRMMCLNIGENNHTGVYVIGTCSEDWSGPPEMRENCEHPHDYSSPLLAAPGTHHLSGVTYRNHYCAKCNNINTDFLKLFRIILSCEGLEGISDRQILSDLIYSNSYKSWGVSRLSKDNELRFYPCTMLFEVPSYLKKKMRFCRANLVSSCNRFWRGDSVKRRCAGYMAVVYDGSLGYRNPHCAFCNYKFVDEITCRNDLFSRKQPTSSVLLQDINERFWPNPGSEIPNCQYKYMYDPYSDNCRQLKCDVPGMKLFRGKCVR